MYRTTVIAVIIRFVLAEYEARIQNTEFVEYDLGTYFWKYCPVSNASYGTRRNQFQEKCKNNVLPLTNQRI